LVGSIQGVLLAMVGAAVTMITNIISGLLKGMIPGGQTEPRQEETESEDCS